MPTDPKHALRTPVRVIRQDRGVGSGTPSGPPAADPRGTELPTASLRESRMQDRHQQHPLLKAISGGQPAEDISEWDARFEQNVAIIIRQLHELAPPPRPSQVARDLLEWAADLEADGQSRLESLGLPHLRALPGAAAAQG